MVTNHSVAEAKVTLKLLTASSLSQLTLPEAQVTEASETWTKPMPWKSQVGMTRAEKQGFLSDLSFWVGDDEDLEVLPFTAWPKDWFFEQHMLSGWLCLRWSAQVSAVTLVDPSLSGRFLVAIAKSADPEEAAQAQVLAQLMLREVKHRLALLPVPSSAHWTLLSLEFDAAKQVSAIRYRDSLSQECALSRQNAQLLLSVFAGPEAELPPRLNCCRQPEGSGTCGAYVLAYAEQECSEAAGEGPAARGWASDLVERARTKLSTFHSGLNVELGKVIAEEKKAAEKAVKELEQLEKRAKNAVALDEGRKALLEHALHTKAILRSDHWIDHLSEADLSEKALQHIQRAAEIALLGCTKCRFGNGCKDCSKWGVSGVQLCL